MIVPLIVTAFPSKRSRFATMSLAVAVRADAALVVRISATRARLDITRRIMSTASRMAWMTIPGYDATARARENKRGYRSCGAETEGNSVVTFRCGNERGQAATVQGRGSGAGQTSQFGRSRVRFIHLTRNRGLWGDKSDGCRHTRTKSDVRVNCLGISRPRGSGRHV